MDNRRRDLDLWKEVVKKAVNAKVKTSLQIPSKTTKIDSRYPKGYRPSAKKNNEESIQKHWDRDKAKFHNPSLTNS